MDIYQEKNLNPVTCSTLHVQQRFIDRDMIPLYNSGLKNNTVTLNKSA